MDDEGLPLGLRSLAIRSALGDLTTAPKQGDEARKVAGVDDAPPPVAESRLGSPRPRSTGTRISRQMA